MRIILTLMLLWTTTAYAVDPFEMNLPAMCGDKVNILDGLKNKYNEDLVFITKGENELGDTISHSLWINQATLTWSFIVVNKEKDIACLIASGDRFNIFIPQGQSI